MKKTTSLRTSPLRAFTLVELLVAVAIIAALAALSFGMLSFFGNRQSEEKTRLLMNQMRSALEHYHDANGGYPEPDKNIRYSSNALYKALFGDFNGDGIPDDGEVVYIADLDPELYKGMKGKKTVGLDPVSGLYLIYDAWGEPYRYRIGFSYKGDGENPDFDIWSLGGDKREGTKDDIADFHFIPN